MTQIPSPLWTPTAQQIADTRMTYFRLFVNKSHDQQLGTYDQLYAWSIQKSAQFWEAVWDFCGVISAHKGTKIIQHHDVFEKTRFFPDARLNYAENILKHRDPEQTAIIFWNENQQQRHLSFKELHDQVEKVAGYLRSIGVICGDRVAGLVPDVPEAMITALAVTSIGAIWSSCSPDFGIQGILDRLGQIQPKVVFATDGYFYKGKTYSCFEKIQSLSQSLSNLNALIVIDYTKVAEPFDTLDSYISYQSIVDQPARQSLTFEQVAFDHPLFVVYSSGTTGLPKCILHGHGGTLLQHLKEHKLHCDIQVGDRVFYYTMTSWMMWNWHMSALASGATLVLYDGSPFYPHDTILMDLAQDLKITHFGTSAKYIDAMRHSQLEPMKTHDLSYLRMITSTGSALSPECFEYVYNSISKDVCLASISGGTDILSCFALGNPVAPVWCGELQTPGLGLAVDVYDDQGISIRGQKGELVCTQPFPSMPVGFWNDPEGVRFHDTYFNHYPQTWYHGDYVEMTEHGGVIFFGRSDAILKPGGVRIGTSEIYRQVEKFPEIVESVVIGQLYKNNERIILFVKLTGNTILTEELKTRIRQMIRQNTTSRHIPEVIIAVPDVPRTVSGKIVELAVRNIVNHLPVKNRESLANPESLDYFKDMTELA